MTRHRWDSKVDSDEETCPQHQEHEEPRAQVAQPAEKRSCAPETAGNARRGCTH